MLNLGLMVTRVEETDDPGVYMRLMLKKSGDPIITPDGWEFVREHEGVCEFRKIVPHLPDSLVFGPK